MPRSNLAVQKLGTAANAAVTYQATDDVNGDRIIIKDNGTRIIFRNTTGGPITATINSVPAGPLARTGDLAVVVAASTDRVLDMLPKQGFEQPSGDDVGYVTIDYSASGLTVAAIE